MDRPLRLVSLCAVLALAGEGSALLGQASAPIAGQFEGLHFRSIGPAVMSGRVTDVAVFEKKPSIYYVASAHSGLWKTTNDGVTFTAEFQDQGLMSIGDVTISQTNPNLVWIGTGEANNRQSTSWGDGVYKSTDGGKSWKDTGLRQSFHINRIAMDPQDNDVVFVAAGGSLFGPGGDRGVFKTTDGGATWKRTLTVDDDTGANEVVMDPTNSRILYASTYQRRRSQCCFNGGGPGSGLWKSTDGGNTWTRLTAGIPAGPLGRIGLDIYRKSPNVLYALIEAESAAAGGRGGGGNAGASQTGLYRSDDAGASWRKISGVDPRPMYFSQVRIDPNNADHLIVANVQIMLSTDGGKTFASADPTIHDDAHAIWWDPGDSDHIVIGTDGGVGVSWDMTKTWRFLPNLPIGLFYHAGFDMETPFNVCGGMQDNDVWCGPSAVRTQRGIPDQQWSRLQIGDGTVTIVDPLDSRTVYSSTQDGSLQRKNRVTGESRSIRPLSAPGDPPLRWNWDTPIVFSPHDHALLVAAQKVFKSTDRGDSWTPISPDLTTNANRADIVTMGLEGRDIRISPNDGISAWPTIVSLAESPRQPGLYYTGTDDGVVSVSRDGGKIWRPVTDRLPGFPTGAWVSEVVPSRFDAGTVYVTVDAHRLNDFGTYVWAGRDFGESFQSIHANLTGEVVKTLTEDQRNPDVLYAGTETGIFLTLDRGKSWSRLKANLPTVRVDEITLHPRDNAMIVATHGRAFWILDHLEPIQEYAAAHDAPDDAKLFSIRNGLEWKPTNELNMEFWGDGFFLGENPPFEAVIQFYVKRAGTDVRLKMTDAAGRVVRELGLPTRNQPGIQTACWDLRVEPLPAPNVGAGRGGGPASAAGRGGAAVADSGPNAGFDNICGTGGGRGAAAPYVPPGAYTVVLLIDGRVVDTKPMNVARDPAVHLTDAQEKRYDEVVIDLHDMQRRGEAAAAALAPLYTQMVDITSKLPAMTTVPASVHAQFGALGKEFDALRVKFGVPAPAAGGRGGRGSAPNPDNVVGHVGTLKSEILAFWEPPSDTLMKEYADVKHALPKAIVAANAFLLNARTMSQALQQYDIALTVPAPIK